MEKLLIDFEIPKALDNEIDRLLYAVNVCKWNRRGICSDVFIEIEDAVMTNKITLKQGELLNSYYCGIRKLRV